MKRNFLFELFESLLHLRLVRGTSATALGIIVLATVVSMARVEGQQKVQYNRDVRPILADHCFRCHGFDVNARKSGLRLDDRASAIQPADSGETAIVPGEPAVSHMLERIASKDEDIQMPPQDAQRRLTDREIEILRRWIAEGAEYQRHWSFEPIEMPDVPQIADTQHPIDAFVAAGLQQQGLVLAPEADRATLLRRVSLDLTGLPPTIDELDHISDETWKQTVDRLLESPHFGERMAVDWLDAARYADTDGYFGDKPRQMWLWRDWVIDAFNRNMPYDQFTIEQLAGDLLPDATIAQKIATGFNRNHMSNDETGLIDEEFRVEYVVDRVDTTLSTWLGLTVGCAQCHDHKYDPVSQREYYQLFAFFNNVPETGLLLGNNAPPRISVVTEEQQRDLTARTAATAAAMKVLEPLKSETILALAARESELLSKLPSVPVDGVILHGTMELSLDDHWHGVGTSLQEVSGIRGQGLKFDATQHLESELPDWSLDAPWTIGVWLRPDGSLSCPLSRIELTGNRRGLEVLWQKGRIIVNLVNQWGTNAIEVLTREPVAAKQWHHLVVSYDGASRASGLQVFIDGNAVATEVRRDTLSGTLTSSEPLRIGRRDDGLGYYGLVDELRIVSHTVSPPEVASWSRSERLRGILETSAAERTAADSEVLLNDFIDHIAEPAVRNARDAFCQAQTTERELQTSFPTALVMDDLSPPRMTRILERGQYDKPGEEVEPGVPTALSSWPDGAPRNRLGFARWLMTRDNPLTARVAVNRLWKQCFGEGLVRTVNDFGTQGEPPKYPELLDFLAATFRDSGWDVKELLRLIVTSQTYRQRSQLAVRDGEIVDSENYWLARGSSFRLPMEMLRDQALASSGLLVRRIGGPSVKPYQPPGLWEDVSYNSEETYEVDRGDGRWRRSVYTYIKRQSPPPTLLLFDGPTREKCTLRRARTNTPLQALLLLNDETYVEAARLLAQNSRAAAQTDSDLLTRIFRSVLARHPRSDEILLLMDLLDRERQRFAAKPVAATELLSIGATPVDSKIDPMELAARTVVAHTILNLDEAITRR